MFKLAFHGGPAVEVLSYQGKNPFEKWKKEGGAVQKTYSKEVKSSVYIMANTTKLTLPADEHKQSLGLQ